MCTVRIKQKSDTILFVKSSKTNCSFDASEGAVYGEDSLGRYGESNAEFRLRQTQCMDDGISVVCTILLTRTNFLRTPRLTRIKHKLSKTKLRLKFIISVFY